MNHTNRAVRPITVQTSLTQAVATTTEEPLPFMRGVAHGICLSLLAWGAVGYVTLFLN